MAMLERRPNEIMQATASHLSLSDVLELRVVCSSTEAGIRNYITTTYCHALRVRFSEGGLHYLARKTRCQYLIKGMRLMTVRFYQIPSYHLDHMDSSRLKRLHRDFIASSWHDSEPHAANIMRKWLRSNPYNCDIGIYWNTEGYTTRSLPKLELWG